MVPTESCPHGTLPELAIPDGGVKSKAVGDTVFVNEKGVLETIVKYASSCCQI